VYVSVTLVDLNMSTVEFVSTKKLMIEKLLRTFCVCASYFAVVGRCVNLCCKTELQIVSLRMNLHDKRPTLDIEDYRVSQKSSPPTTFNDIFAWAESFCIKFCTFIGNLYPDMCTHFRLFKLTFNEMSLLLLRAPIIFTVSSLDCSAGNKDAEYQLNINIGQWS